MDPIHTWLPRGGRVGRVLPAVVADTAKAEGVALNRSHFPHRTIPSGMTNTPHEFPPPKTQKPLDESP